MRVAPRNDAERGTLCHGRLDVPDFVSDEDRLARPDAALFQDPPQFPQFSEQRRAALVIADKRRVFGAEHVTDDVIGI